MKLVPVGFAILKACPLDDLQVVLSRLFRQIQSTPIFLVWSWVGSMSGSEKVPTIESALFMEIVLLPPEIPQIRGDWAIKKEAESEAESPVSRDLTMA